MKRLLIAQIAGFSALFAPPLTACADPAFPYSVGDCFTCHGTDGKSQTIMPPLAGRDKSELLEMLKGYKDGKIPSTIMTQLAKGYSDDELIAFAEFFAAQK